MSYILDALRKAETERALTRVSRIASPRQPGFAHKGGALKRLIPVVLATIFSVVLTWWWTSHGLAVEANTLSSAPSSENPAAKANEVATKRDQIVSTGLVAPSSAGPANLPVPPIETVVAMTPPAIKRDPLGAVATLLPVSERQVEKITSEDRSSEKPQDASSLSPGAGLVADKTVAMIASEAERILPPQAVVEDDTNSPVQPTEAERTGDEKPLQDEELPPLLRTLPYRFQSTLPKIVINAQAYADEVEARFVIINMKKYREGDRTEAGIVIEEIAETYLVMSYQGQVFRKQR